MSKSRNSSEDLVSQQHVKTVRQPYFYPEYQHRHGYGHIARMARLQQRFFRHAPFVINSEEDYQALQFIVEDRVPREQCVLWGEIVHRIPLLVVDVPLCDKKTVLRLKRKATIVVGIDGRGSGMQFLDYTIDLLPRVGTTLSNLSAYSLMPLQIDGIGGVGRPVAGAGDDSGGNNNGESIANDSSNGSSSGVERCLIYFNGKQRKRLIKIGYAFAIRRLQIPRQHICHVVLSDRESVSSGQKGIFVGNRLSDCLNEFHTVITLVGVTALEAALLDKSVYLINPSSYHNAVSRQLGLQCHTKFMGRRVYSAPYEKISEQGFGAVAGRKNYDFNAIIDNIMRVHPAACPNCNTTLYHHLHRSPGRVLVSCVNCGLRFFRYFVPNTISYQHDYFTEAYQKRYGDQYTEQHQQLERLAHARIQKIHRYISMTSTPSAASVRSASPPTSAAAPKRLLDIGCAYGTFLSVAQSYDYRVYGVELNIEAAQSTRTHYRCPVATTDFTTLDVERAFGVSDFDVITLWYVIEHIVPLSDFIQKIWQVTKQGGIVVIATPNPHSILDRTVPHYTAMTSPREHYAVLSINSLRSLLRKAGFKVVGVWNHGIHPEYYPTISPKLATVISNIFRLGTTYSMFAIRPLS